MLWSVMDYSNGLHVVIICKRHSVLGYGNSFLEMSSMAKVHIEVHTFHKISLFIVSLNIAGLEILFFFFLHCSMLNLSQQNRLMPD